MSMTQAEVREMHDKIMQNDRALQRCRGPHQLEAIKGTVGAGTRFRCTLCKGEIAGGDARWYLIGLEHGRTAAGGSNVPGVHG